MTDRRTSFEFGQNDPGYQLAFLLRCIEEQEIELAQKIKELKDDYGPRITRLQIERARLQHGILTGQKEMFTPEPQDKRILEVMEKTAELVNSGALDTKNVKVTAKVGKS